MRGFLVLVHVLVVVLHPAQVLTAVNGEPLHVCLKWMKSDTYLLKFVRPD